MASNCTRYSQGIVFGLQPDTMIDKTHKATAYILMFVFGTVAAMGSYTAFIGKLIVTCSHLCRSGEKLWLTSAVQHVGPGEFIQL